MLNYSNFKTLLLQLVAEKDQEKHQPVKNVDSQERATRKGHKKGQCSSTTVPVENQ